uniref:Cysteine dioxygenase n=1 Tax=Cyprinus carpio carpio TaxID=630221 RepID=A0A9J8ADT1_CYPCA
MEHTELIKPETLQDLIQALHEIFESDRVNVEEVQSIMESYESKPHEWMKYARFDQYRYTRNLVDEGNGKFNLMILCWGEGHGSSIHDHTDSHCFMKLLQGQLKETLFDWPDRKLQGGMQQKSQRVLLENQCAYINGESRAEAQGGVCDQKSLTMGSCVSDSLGLHRVENVSHTETAVSLHLYSPPFQTCQTFDQRTGHRNTVKMTFWSRFGERTAYAGSVSQENN